MEGLIKTPASLMLDISLLTLDESTLKAIDAEHKLKLKLSIEKHGQLRNVLIDPDFRVVEGRRIVAIMRELGYTEVEVKRAPIGHELLSRLALDSEYSTFDFVQVSVELEKHFDLTNKGVLFDKLPFCNDDIKDYIESTAFAMDKFNAHMQPRQQDIFGQSLTVDESIEL